jgi:predicted nucleotide-binding protein (sugar kinase/HSP70/actin superfamily)
MGAVEVDRTKVKPKVGIIGEFWAMTTEGDGNYGLQRFLEAEGAEVDIQLVTAWLRYMIWQGKYDTAQRASLRGTTTKAEGALKFSLKNVDVRKRMATLWAADKVVRACSSRSPTPSACDGYNLADMDEIAEISHAFYDNNLRGGEGHMEVGKLIQNVAYAKVNMTLSVKPFGCMPSVVGVGRRAEPCHRAVPAGHLPADRDQRRRRGQRVQPRADAAVQGQAAGAARGRDRAQGRRHDHG